jgi:hypothetical protein
MFTYFNIVRFFRADLLRAVSALGHLRPEGEVIYLWGIAQYGSLKAEKVVN